MVLIEAWIQKASVANAETLQVLSRSRGIDFYLYFWGFGRACIRRRGFATVWSMTHNEVSPPVHLLAPATNRPHAAFACIVAVR